MAVVVWLKNIGVKNTHGFVSGDNYQLEQATDAVRAKENPKFTVIFLLSVSKNAVQCVEDVLSGDSMFPR